MGGMKSEAMVHDHSGPVGTARRSATPAARHHAHEQRPFPLPDWPPNHSADDHWNQVVARLDMAFQPIVNIHTGACYGYEALLRNTAEAGFATIQDFFDRCHAHGILADIEMVLREKAVAKFATLGHHRQSKLFINLDNRSLVHRLIQMVQAGA